MSDVSENENLTFDEIEEGLERYLDMYTKYKDDIIIYRAKQAIDKDYDSGYDEDYLEKSMTVNDIFLKDKEFYTILLECDLPSEEVINIKIFDNYYKYAELTSFDMKYKNLYDNVTVDLTFNDYDGEQYELTFDITREKARSYIEKYGIIKIVIGDVSLWLNDAFEKIGG